MSGPIEIKGGAGDFEAAVVAVVLEHLEKERIEAAKRRPTATTRPPAWLRAGHPSEPRPFIGPDPGDIDHD